VLDIGTGLRFWGETLPTDGTFRGTALVTHLHWDHVQGLPFFVPIDRPGAQFDIYAPDQGEEGELSAVFDNLMRPPYFPVRARDLRGDIRFHGVIEADLAIGDAKVKVRPVPHPGPTVGYRIDWDGLSVAYISDHQQPLEGNGVVDSVLELCEGVDLLIHDAQYTPDEFEQKKHWGHCTIEYAVQVARESSARCLVLFHHDPARDDDSVDRLLVEARRMGERAGIDEVVAAYEGLTFAFAR
jgi:phosphoribosyl 1,2-cyclic phosphodiesterase